MSCDRAGDGVELLRRIGCIGVAIIIAALGVVGLGAGVGRFHIVPVARYADGVHPPAAAVAVVMPVSARTVKTGDIVAARTGGDRTDMFYEVDAVDSWTHRVYAVDRDGRVVELKVGGRVGRVERFVPYVGAPYRIVAGTVQGLALLTVAVLLLVSAARRRGAIASRARRHVRSMLAAVVWSVAVLALTAGASFTASATVDQSAITTGHMGFTLPPPGSTHRLQTGATGLAPGDLMQRPIDLEIDALTTPGMIGSVELQMGGSSTGGAGGVSYKLDDASNSSMKIWIQKCATAWVEAIPSYTYTCAGGAANVSEVLGSSLPYAPEPNNCPPSASVPKVNTVAGAAQALSNITTTPGAHNYLLVFMCLPTAADDNYQDASSTFTFSFSGVQRAGTDI